MLAGAAAAALLVAAIRFWPGGEEDAIRRRLDDLAAEINGGGSGGVDALARAAAIGGYFSDDVVIELGRGASPIQGRPLLIDMVARLRPRTSRFEIRFTDVTVRLTGQQEASVDLTAEIIPPEDSAEHLDAREFTAELIKDAGEWRISRAAVVEPLR